MSIADIRSDFAVLDDWEDRYRYVIELGRALLPLEDAARTDANKVRGCTSQVWLATEIVPPADGSGAPRLRFRGDSDAHIVRGLVAILFTLYQNKTPDEILAIDARSVLGELGLQEHLTPQRSNGFVSMIERIRADARAVASGISSRAN
ncbi:MAG: SufE family protein [Hyphomicrobiaceae bacterium]|nr:SufE family protein [Hyphomicrobiaceae bacterium]